MRTQKRTYRLTTNYTTTMTWSVFIQTMRQGLTNRASVATRRANPQRSGVSTTRNNSTQAPAVNKTDTAKENPADMRDSYFIDVSEYVFLSKCCIQESISIQRQEMVLTLNNASFFLFAI